MAVRVQSFAPLEPVHFTDAWGREFDFVQSQQGSIEVRVRYGAQEIDRIFHSRIFVERASQGLRRPAPNSFFQMAPEEIKNVLDSLKRAVEQNPTLGANSSVEFSSENGSATTVLNREKEKYIPHVNSITIYLK